MKDQAFRWALGLMSGTSVDGIDVALIETDGQMVRAFGPAESYPFDATTRQALRDAMALAAGLAPGPDIPGELAATGDLVADAHADAIAHFRASHDLPPIDVIGFHGQTVRHAPDLGLTWQVGNAVRLAAATGVTVVADFRRADVAAGGEGAPLVPLYHAALLRSARLPGRDVPWPVAVLNLGGVGNVTWVECPGAEARILAFDTGPGNALLDDWVHAHDAGTCDMDGKFARAGQVDQERLRAWLSHPYFDAKPPKSLDRDTFAVCRPDGLSLEDGAATLTAFTAGSVARALDHMPVAPALWFVTGGGRRNAAIMAALRELLGAPVEAVDALGWRGDSLEAEAFGFLAVRSLQGLPLSLPATTGVRAPQTGGRLFLPHAR